MSRDIHDSTRAALQGQQLAPIGLVELLFDSGAFRMWTGVGTLSWNGYEWQGAPTGRIGPIEETTELRAVGMELGVSGVPDEVLDLALAEEWQNRPAAVYYAVLDDAMGFVGEPFQVFGGVMDVMQLAEGTQAAVSIACESDMIDLERTRARRYTAEDQRSEYPGDRGFDSVAAVQEVDVKWGRGF